MGAGKFFVRLLVYVAFVTMLTAGCSDNTVPQGVADSSRDSSPVAVTAPAPVDMVIQGGQLLDMVSDNPSPVPIKGLVIIDGTINKIIPADSSEPLPAAIKTIDASSLYILPGLIDSHVHFHPWTHDASVWRRGNLHYGVTTIVDTGPSGAADHCTGDLDKCEKPEPNEWIVEFKDFLNNSPESNGPTLYITGIKLDEASSEYQFSSHRFQSLDEIPEYIDYLVSLGVDAIKAEKGLPVEYRRKIIEEAGRHGLMVVGHSRDARESISVGMKFIEHMWPIAHSLADEGAPEDFDSPDQDYLMNLDKAPDLIKLMVDNGVYLNPTLVGRYGDLSERASSFTAEDEALLKFGQIYSIGLGTPDRLYERVLSDFKLPENIDASELQRLREGYTKVQSFLKLFSEAGGLVITATDNTMTKLPGITMHREMQLLVDAGISPGRVLLGATRFPAEMLRKNDLIGTIETAKQADMLLLGSNPVVDIANSKDIQYVIRKGKVVSSADQCSVILPPVSQTCK